MEEDLEKYPDQNSGGARTLTTFFTRMTRQEKKSFFKSEKGILLINILVALVIIGVIGGLFAIVVWFLFIK